jgi:RNA polymerase sigma-70 factor (ECF subfamily)
VAGEPDERLIESAQAGDLDAFNALVARYERVAFGMALRMLHDPTAAEDATQESFIAAWSRIGTFRGGSFKAWLLRIVVNRCYDDLRRRQRRRADSLDVLPVEEAPAWSTQTPAVTPEDHVLRDELLRHIEAGIRRLPDDQRLTLILADVEGQPYEQIAEITGANIGTVKSRLSRARAKLRADLRATGELFQRYLRQDDEPSSR